MSSSRRRRRSAILPRWLRGATGIYSLRQLRPGRTVITSSSFVTQWTDQSGKNNNLLATGTSPTLTETGIRFTSANSNYLVNNNSFEIGSDFSAFLVISNNSHISNSGVLSLIPSQPSPNHRDWASASGRALTQNISSPSLIYIAHLQFSGSNGFTDSITITTTSPALGTFYILSVTQGNGIASVQVNNNPPLQDTYNGTPSSPAGVILGARFDAGIGGFGNFDIKELIMFPADKSAERTSIISEINKFYGLF
jgi:hypothetical protein